MSGGGDLYERIDKLFKLLKKDIAFTLSYASLDLAVLSLKVSTTNFSPSSFLDLTVTLALNLPSCQSLWHLLQTVSCVERLLLSNDDFPCFMSK